MTLFGFTVNILLVNNGTVMSEWFTKKKISQKGTVTVVWCVKGKHRNELHITCGQSLIQFVTITIKKPAAWIRQGSPLPPSLFS